MIKRVGFITNIKVDTIEDWLKVAGKKSQLKEGDICNTDSSYQQFVMDIDALILKHYYNLPNKKHIIQHYNKFRVKIKGSNFVRTKNTLKEAIKFRNTYLFMQNIETNPEKNAKVTQRRIEIEEIMRGGTTIEEWNSRRDYVLKENDDENNFNFTQEEKNYLRWFVDASGLIKKVQPKARKKEWEKDI